MADRRNKLFTLNVSCECSHCMPRVSVVSVSADRLAQLVEHRTAVREVAGSNLGRTLRVLK